LFIHQHPYSPFIPKNATKLIVGTLPPPRFSTGELKEGDIDFCYGSKDGQLWKILNQIFNLNLKFETSQEAIEQRKDFLEKRGIGICDIVERAERLTKESSDLGMKNIQLRNLLQYLKEYPSVSLLLFTGGNSANGPEFLFRRHLNNMG
jgi:G:T/U-mismatch repair DNA glycosylase